MDNFETRDSEGREAVPTRLGQVKKEEYSGDFVRDSQDMGTKEGFRSVSKLWLDQCGTFDHVLEQLAE